MLAAPSTKRPGGVLHQELPIAQGAMGRPTKSGALALRLPTVHFEGRELNR